MNKGVFFPHFSLLARICKLRHFYGCFFMHLLVIVVKIGKMFI